LASVIRLRLQAGLLRQRLLRSCRTSPSPQVQPVDGPSALAYALATGRVECIAVNTSAEGIIVNPQTLSTHEVDIIARRIREEATRMAQEAIRAKL